MSGQKSMKIWLNGRMLDEKKACVSVWDRGFLYGDGVYETVRGYPPHGRIFLWDQHWRRFVSSVRGLRLFSPWTKLQVEKGIRRIIKLNGWNNVVVRITLTRGPGPLGFDPRPCRKPTLVILSQPARKYPVGFYRKGVRLALATIRRNPKEALNPEFKTTNNLNNILAKMESLRMKAFEALMLNMEGFVAEGTISNVFWVRRKVLFTPALNCGILPGVTRSLVIQLARQLGMPVREVKATSAELQKADEVFLTSTTLEMMPVREIVSSTGTFWKISGECRNVTSLLSEFFKEKVSAYFAHKSNRV